MSSLAAAFANRRGALIALAVALAVAVGVAVYNGKVPFAERPGATGVAGSAQNVAQQGVNGLRAVGDTVASLFGGRSPGERMAGILANLKNKRHAIGRPRLHERALPKVRRAPLNPLAGIVGAVPPSPSEAVPVEQVPLEKAVTGAGTPPVSLTPVGGSGGSPLPGGFPPVDFPGGGGGGVIIPPTTITPPVVPPVVTPPVTPPTTAVPEPASWMMMLLGFLGIGAIVRRGSRVTAA